MNTVGVIICAVIFIGLMIAVFIDTTKHPEFYDDDFEDKYNGK